MMVATHVLRQIVGGCDYIADIAAALELPRKTINKAAQTLKGRGLIETHSAIGGEVSGPARRGFYRPTSAGIAFAASGQAVMAGQGERPRKKTVGLRERAWWHFRAHKVASLKELLTTHAEGQERDATSNVYKYLLALESVGILQRSAKRIPARQCKGLIVWRLALDLGPKAPVWRQTSKTVFDPNSDRVFQIEEGAAK